MKIYLCNSKGDVSCGSPCRVFGLDRTKPGEGWEVHVVMDIVPTDELIGAVLEFMKIRGDAYSDRLFSTVIEDESPATMKSAFVWVLDDRRFNHIPYTMHERVYHIDEYNKVVFHDEWIETHRRIVLTSPMP